MNLVDSSAWLEYFADGPNAKYFSHAIESTAELLVPTVCLAEVFKRILTQRDEGRALTAITAMQQGRVVDLTAAIALTAARLGAESGLPFADSVILATARVHGAEVWTQDAHFKDVEGVKYKR